MPTSTPLSYQTTMPEYPDVSYEAYGSYLGNPTINIGGQNVPYNRAGLALLAHQQGKPNYETWRTNLLDDYNAKMSAYDTWLKTGEGQRASLESGGYNPSYFGGQSATASPLSYGNVSESSGLSEMAQGVQGLFSFANALAGLKMIAAQVTGQNLKNEGQAIANKWADRLAGQKYLSLGYQNDWRAQNAANMIFPTIKSIPELWKSGLYTSPHTGMTYDMSMQDQSLGYQRAVSDLDLTKASIALREATTEMAKWNAKEKEWFSQNIWQIQKDILSGQLTYLNGEINFQAVDQRLRKAGVISGIAKDVVSSVIDVAKLFLKPRLSFGKSESPSYQTPLPDLQDIFGTLSN